MKKLLLTASLLLIMTAVSTQSCDFKNVINKIIVQDEKTISIKNGGYNAITVELYVKDGYEWKYLQSVRIPGGSTVTYAIGKYENYFNYGYMKQSENNYYSVASFYSSIITLY